MILRLVLRDCCVVPWVVCGVLDLSELPPPPSPIYIHNTSRISRGKIRSSFKEVEMKIV
jgi:hypothetical protein